MPDLTVQVPRDLSPKEQHQYALQLRHKLAMELVGLIRTCLNVQRPMFEALLNAEQQASGSTHHQAILHGKSFALQIRLVKTCLKFLNKLDSLAEEAILLAEREKFNG